MNTVEIEKMKNTVEIEKSKNTVDIEKMKNTVEIGTIDMPFVYYFLSPIQLIEEQKKGK
jgi:hypothetical protein